MIFSEPMRHQVVAIVVTYYPKVKDLSELLSALAPQVERLVMVDNTPAIDSIVVSLVQEFPSFSIEVVRLGENFGVAKALNVGIARAIGLGATHVLLSDQDSLPAHDMVGKLLDVAQLLRMQGVRLGCVGPAFRNISTSLMHKFHVPGRFFYATCAGENALPFIEVISNITSGSLIPVEIFADVGLMREDYFIDFVDTEWCFRARHRGCKVYGTALALMEHRVGGETFRAWWGKWKTFSGYSYDRLYYQYRNGIFLLREARIPLGWKLRLALTWCSNILAYIFFAPHRLGNLRAIGCGIWGGLRGSDIVLKGTRLKGDNNAGSPSDS